MREADHANVINDDFFDVFFVVLWKQPAHQTVDLPVKLNVLSLCYNL